MNAKQWYQRSTWGFLPRLSCFLYQQKHHLLLLLQAEAQAQALRSETEMGNCQAVDAATLVIQHPGPSGRVDKLYWPVHASEIMKTNPGHYVALLISTTLCPTATTAADHKTTQNKPLRVTRIKLLRPTDTLLLGQVYRLITAQDVMKGLGAKKQAKMRKALSETVEKLPAGVESTSRRSEMDKESHHQVTRHERHRQRSTPSSYNNSAATARPRTWQPSLHSISEAAS